jgi:hypothetical protein
MLRKFMLMRPSPRLFTARCQSAQRYWNSAAGAAVRCNSELDGIMQDDIPIK